MYMYRHICIYIYIYVYICIVRPFVPSCPPRRRRCRPRAVRHLTALGQPRQIAVRPLSVLAPSVRPSVPSSKSVLCPSVPMCPIVAAVVLCQSVRACIFQAGREFAARKLQTHTHSTPQYGRSGGKMKSPGASITQCRIHHVQTENEAPPSWSFLVTHGLL